MTAVLAAAIPSEREDPCTVQSVEAWWKMTSLFVRRVDNPRALQLPAAEYLQERPLNFRQALTLRPAIQLLRNRQLLSMPFRECSSRASGCESLPT